MKNYLLLGLLLLSILSNSKAQEANVAFKVLEYHYKYNKNIHLNANCELADLEFTHSNGTEVYIKCTYSARHADKSIATQELSRHQILVRKTLNDILLSNYFTINSGETEPKAKLRIKFEIALPDGITVDIHNNFGSVSIINVPIKGTITQDYGKVLLQKVAAPLVIKGQLTLMNIQDMSGNLEVKNKSGDISIVRYTGSSLKLTNANANVTIDQIANTTQVQLTLSHGELLMKNMDYNQHELQIESYKIPIVARKDIAPIDYKGDYYRISKSRPLPLLKITSTYTKIQLL